jgi:ABC-type uncharacterized transport system permease subunit
VHFLGAVAACPSKRIWTPNKPYPCSLVSGLFIFAFLTWAAAGRDHEPGWSAQHNNLSKAVPITLGALSGILCERAGVVNIAIEGMMLSGAMVGIFNRQRYK